MFVPALTFRANPAHNVTRPPNIFSSNISAKRLAIGDAAPMPLPLPESCDISTFGPNVLVELRDEWTPSGGTASFAKGSLVSIPATDLLPKDPGMPATYANAVALFTPTASSSLQSFHGTRNFLVVSTLDDVRGRLHIWGFDFATSVWSGKGEYAHADLPAKVEKGAPPQEVCFYLPLHFK